MRGITVKSPDECKNRNTPQMFTLVHFMPNKISVIYVLLAVKVGGMAWWCPNEGRDFRVAHYFPRIPRGRVVECEF